MASVLTTGANTLSQSIDRVTNSFENFKTQTQSFQGNLDDVSKKLDKVNGQQEDTNKYWKSLNGKLETDEKKFKEYDDYYHNEFVPNHKWKR